MDKSSAALSLFDIGEPTAEPVKRFRKKRGPWRSMTLEERQVFSEIEAIFARRREVKRLWRDKKDCGEKWARGKKPKMPGVPKTPRPIGCAILGVDPGKKSGWCLLIDGEIVDHGHCSTDTKVGMLEVAKVCELAILEAKRRALPIVVSVEKPGMGRRNNSFIVGGVEAARRCWINEFIRAGGQRSLVSGAVATSHRKVVFGHGGMDTKTAQREERKYALRVLGMSEGCDDAKKMTADECAAVAQTHGWARTSGIVAMKINKFRRYLAPLR